MFKAQIDCATMIIDEDINNANYDDHYDQNSEESVKLSAHSMEFSNVSTSSSSSSSSPSSISFPYKDIHSHCLTCVRPLKCIRKPNFYFPSNSNNVLAMSNDEIYSMILNVNYHQNGMLHNGQTNSDELEHCPVVQCPNHCCNVILHYCKLPEHYLLCLYQKIACINNSYGCPFFILRKDVASHLKHCPANVVHCSMEWNRWPLHTTEKNPQTRVYCPPQSLDIRNLDVALALRDQRMLKQLWSASRQMKRIMKGRLSIHPAVPIKPYIGVRTYREYGNCLPNSIGTNGSSQTPTIIVHHDEERYIAFASKLVDAAYHESLIEILKRTAMIYRKTYDQRKLLAKGENSSYQRKKSNSICQMTLNLSNLTSPTNGTVVPSLLPTIISMPSSSSINLPIFSDSIIQHINEPTKIPENHIISGSSCVQQNSVPKPPPPPPVPKCNALSLEVSIRSLAAYQPKPRAMYTFRCGMDFRVDEYRSHYKDIHSDIHGGLDGWIEHRCPLFQYGCNYVHRRWSPTSCGTRKTLIYNENLEAFACTSIPIEQVDEINSQFTEVGTRKRSSINSSTSYEPESSSTYSRCCRSNSNTTCYTSSNQWNSSKYCSTMSLLSPTSALSSPMSSPTYSLVSTPEAPSPCSSKSFRNEGQTTFNQKQQQRVYCLNNFPYEILQHICSFLDGYSLNNLSFTSQRLRLVIQSYLKKKGYVLLQWKRFEIEKGKYRWTVAHKKWMFSTAIEPITNWTINSDNVMAEHLQTCPFNERVVQTEPFKYIAFNKDGWSLQLKRRKTLETLDWEKLIF